MPTVGTKHFPYTTKGKLAAAKLKAQRQKRKAKKANA